MLNDWLRRVFGRPSTPGTPGGNGASQPAASATPGDGGPDYLSRWTWSQRLAHALSELPDWSGGDFAKANAAYVGALSIAKGDEARLHVVFNIGSDALREFMASSDYKNVYEHPVVEGKPLRPSEKRKEVDRIICLNAPENTYFCALSVGGAGMRFYGEYCVALRSPQDEDHVVRVLDRNSYDFTALPLSAFLKGRPLKAQRQFAQKLMCRFRSKELGEMLAIKVLGHHGGRARLLTMGSVGEAVLCDEDYVEAYHEGKIRPANVLEVRSHPEDEMTESSIEGRLADGEATSPEELLWIGRRAEARHAMARAGVVHRVVTGNGRGRRWR